MLACKNLGPILLSLPIACATSDTSAPVSSQMADTALMLEIRWARNALAASLESSEDQVFIVMIFSSGIQCL
uniref:Putative secreted protein n=1 Tax=Ixodes ricinus TaxID=34613 RepID=A0A6B0U361_IXORI